MIGRLLFVGAIFIFTFNCFGGVANFSPEATFYVQGTPIGHHPDESRIPSMLRALLQRCHNLCEIQGSSLVLKDSPIIIDIKTDQGVWEVNFKNPLPYRVHEQHADHVEEVLFKGMRHLQYPPHVVEGAGQVNLGLYSAFGDNTEHFRSFYAFLLSNPGIAMVLGSPAHDYLYATVPQYFSQAAQKRLATILSQPLGQQSTFDIAHAISNEFAQSHPVKDWKSIERMRRKHVAYALRDYHNPFKARIEMRPIRPQQTFHDFVLITKLLQAIVDHTELELSKGNRYTYKIGKPIEDVSVGLQNFKDVITKVGLDPQEFTHFVSPAWQELWKPIVKDTKISCQAVVQ